MTANNNFEIIIIGGSYAGLSAAMALGRSLRKVLVIDSGLPCNSQTPHSQNFLTQDGNTPHEISTLAKKQVEKYKTVEFHQGFATRATKTKTGYEIMTDKKEKFRAKKLIFATGIKDLMPRIKGFAECWGISIIHCPYCHGYEHRNANTGLIANGEMAFHLASMVNNLSDKVTILTNGKADFRSEQIEKMEKHSIKIMESKIVEIDHKIGIIQHIVFNNGSKMFFEVAYAVIPFAQHSDIPVSLGCELTDQGYLKVDGFQKTNIQGVYACGDNSNRMRSVANAVYAGNITGAVVNGELINEQF